MAEQKEEKKDRRRRARETIVFLLQRVEEVCGQVERVDSVADQIEEIAGRIRDFAEATETKELLPERIQGALRDAWQRFEQAKDNNDALVDACKRVKKALKLADGALAGGVPPGVVAAAAVVAAGVALTVVLVIALGGNGDDEQSIVAEATATQGIAPPGDTATPAPPRETPVAPTDTPPPTPTRPDLVGNITGPESACQGNTIGGDITLSISNLGEGEAGEFSVGLYLSADDTITTSDLLLDGGRESVPRLSGGRTVVPLFSGASVPDSTPPSFMFLGLLVDEFDAVVEGDETNNASAVQIEIEFCGPT